MRATRNGENRTRQRARGEEGGRECQVTATILSGGKRKATENGKGGGKYDTSRRRARAGGSGG